MQCGPVRFRVDARQQAAARPFKHQVIVRPTGFRSPFAPDDDPRLEFQKLQDALSKCEHRNRLICADVVETLRDGRTPLVLTARTAHLVELAGRLREHVPQVITLQGGMGKKAFRETLIRLNDTADSASRVLLATGRYIGEGFDDPPLDTLFLALPVLWRGTIARYVGRLHRLHAGKREVRVYARAPRTEAWRSDVRPVYRRRDPEANALHRPGARMSDQIVRSQCSFTPKMSKLRTPRFAALAGASTAKRKPLDGVNVWDVIAKREPSPRTDIVYNVEPFRGAIRQCEWKLIWRTLLPSSVDLYNLTQDPSEQNDLAVTHPEKVAVFKQCLDSLAKESSKPLFIIHQSKVVMNHSRMSRK